MTRRARTALALPALGSRSATKHGSCQIDMVPNTIANASTSTGIIALHCLISPIIPLIIIIIVILTACTTGTMRHGSC